MTEFSLRYFKDVDGKPAWFKGMSGIGPELTTNPSEARRFATKHDAAMSPGNAHPMCPMGVEPAPVIGDEGAAQ